MQRYQRCPRCGTTFAMPLAIENWGAYCFTPRNRGGRVAKVYLETILPWLGVDFSEEWWLKHQVRFVSHPHPACFGPGARPLSRRPGRFMKTSRTTSTTSAARHRGRIIPRIVASCHSKTRWDNLRSVEILRIIDIYQPSFWNHLFTRVTNQFQSGMILEVCLLTELFFQYVLVILAQSLALDPNFFEHHRESMNVIRKLTCFSRFLGGYYIYTIEVGHSCRFNNSVRTWRFVDPEVRFKSRRMTHSPMIIYNSLFIPMCALHLVFTGSIIPRTTP